jgi:uncharacterized protein (TIGR02001 family)
MSLTRTIALVTGLLALSSVSQAQFSSTWTAVSDYDFRGVSQSAKSPALQASADYNVGETGFSFGAWASNVDFDNDEDIEVDVYANYALKINDLFTFTAGATMYTYPVGNDSGNYPEFYVGANLGNFNFKQWYADDFYAAGDTAMYSEVNYTQPIGEKFSLAFHAGYSWGDFWKNTWGDETLDYAVQANYTAGNFVIFAKFTGTDASDGFKITDDVANNEPRGLIGVSTTLPWSK